MRRKCVCNGLRRTQLCFPGDGTFVDNTFLPGIITILGSIELGVLVASSQKMIPGSTFDQLEITENIYDSRKHLSINSNDQLGNWSTQGLQDDGVWVITASFTIFTMTSGFGLLESGRVSSKDEVNIMVKNVIDVIFGGLAYWMFGFGLTFGRAANYVNSFVGIGSFFFDPEPVDENSDGWSYASFIYQMSFATTANSIVSGTFTAAGMAERVRLRAYIIISFIMPLIHSFPAHWLWAENGLLYSLGVIDWAGCAAVHLVGGVAGFVATVFLRPRQGRFGKKGRKQMSNPTNAILGTFMLWWGWLAFNTGSTYGVSHGKWQLAVKSSVATIAASTGGGVTAVVISKITAKNIQIDMIIDGLLAALVSSSACCPCFAPWQAVIVGVVGASLALLTYPILEWLEIDDPVGIIPVHVVGSIWGMLSAGIFAKDDELNWEVTRGNNGILYGGGLLLISLQFFAVVVVSLWATSAVLFMIFVLQHTPVGLRLSKYEEEIGADLREHGLRGHSVKAYRVEKKLTTESLTQVVLFVMRWRAKAKASALRRQLVVLGHVVAETPHSDLRHR